MSEEEYETLKGEGESLARFIDDMHRDVPEWVTPEKYSSVRARAEARLSEINKLLAEEKIDSE